MSGWVLTRHSLDGDVMISLTDSPLGSKPVGESGWVQLYPTRANAEAYARMLQRRDRSALDDYWYSVRKADLTFAWAPEEDDLIGVDDE